MLYANGIRYCYNFSSTIHGEWGYRTEKYYTQTKTNIGIIVWKKITGWITIKKCKNLMNSDIASLRKIRVRIFDYYRMKKKQSNANQTIITSPKKIMHFELLINRWNESLKRKLLTIWPSLPLLQFISSNFMDFLYIVRFAAVFINNSNE